MNLKRLIIALAIFVVLAMVALVIMVGTFVDQAIGGETESIQSAVQRLKCGDPFADSLAAGDSVVVIPDAMADAGADFATGFACSLVAYSPSDCVDDSTFQHFEANETFSFPYPIDSVMVVNKGATTGFHRWWFWRR